MNFAVSTQRANMQTTLRSITLQMFGEYMDLVNTWRSRADVDQIDSLLQEPVFAYALVGSDTR